MKKIPIWKNVVWIISILIVIIIATLAWFITGNFGNIREILFNISEASFIQISADDGKNWSGELDIEAGVNKTFKEISGNGIDFYSPVYDVVQKDDGSFGPEIIRYEKVNDDKLYYDQVFTFQSDADYNIYLAPDSFVKADEEQDNNFIQGAIRVAFIEIEDSGKESLRCIWAPNSKVEFNEDTYSYILDGKTEDNYYFQKTSNIVDLSTLTNESINPDVAKISTIDSETLENFYCGYDAKNLFMWSDDEQLPENAPSLLSIKPENNGSLGYKKLKVRVWIEGHDRECVSLLNGKKFTMKFHFKADKGE